MKKLLATVLVSSVLLFPTTAHATTKRCINDDGCTVVETLVGGTKVTHEVDEGDEFETGSGSSYNWRGGSANWQTL